MKRLIREKSRLLALLLVFALVLPMAAPAVQVSAAETVTESSVETAQTVAASAGMDETVVWDFSSQAQLSDFSMYQSATSRYAIIDGMLAPDGVDGELKAIVTQTPENLKSVSVDLIPGPSGLINAGLYFGASQAANGVDQIKAMVFQIQSNFTGWTDAPNRIDIIQGQFNNQWTKLGTVVSESGNGNALFTKGNKQPLNLKLTFGPDTVLLTLSLRDNPAKYLQLMYEMDPALFSGQVGLRVNGSDTRFDDLQVEYTQPLTEYQKLWDFSDASQADDFTFYTNGNHSFAVADGMLKSNGGNGEMKAIFNEDMANIASMSVDIIPGPSGLMNAGVYVGAKNVSAAQDTADAIAVMVESMFSGWDDAPNRIDLWLGKFAQGWAGEVAGSRLVSETGNQNALYAGGVKKPLNLKLEFGENTMTGTLSLAENPNRFVQKTWTMEAGQLQGQIGLRNQFIDLCYDNLLITYKQPQEQPVPEVETLYENTGYNFCEVSNRPWKLTEELSATPYTLEAWVKVPQGVHDSAVGYIVGNASRAPSVSMQMIQGGKLQLSYAVENADLTVTTKTFDVATDLRTGKWTHMAYTCDVENDRVVAYINGQAAATWNAAGLQAITIPDKILPGNTFALGSKESSDDATHKFLGFIADVRLWDKALTAQQIAQSMMTQYEDPQDGLLFNAPLDEKVDGVFADLSGNDNFVEPYDAMLDLNAESHEPGAYSIVVIPDQQILNNYYPEKLMNLYQWIADNRETENIQMVLNVGDMADNCGNLTQWENNKAAWELLPDDLPFIAAPGNHDYDTNSGWDTGHGIREQLTLMNQYFPRSLFESYPTEIGFFDEVNSANQWQAFEASGNKYLVLALEYVPQADVLAWANEVVESHPNHQAILITHSYVGSYGNLDVPAVWNQFVSQHENIIMAISGHVWHTNIVRRADLGVNGNTVYQMLMDAQVTDTGNEGYKHVGMVGILRFNADGTECRVSYYSTDRDMYDSGSNFTLTLPRQEKTFVAQVGSQSYTSVEEAIAAANGAVVKLLADTNEAVAVTGDVTVDLAGFCLSNVTVAEGATLKLVDTATDDYEGSWGSAKVTGNVEVFTQANGKTYMVVDEDGVYSAHRYGVKITHISLKPVDDALGYKASLLGDERILAQDVEMGFRLWVNEDNIKTYAISDKHQISLRLRDILANDGGQTKIYAEPFVTLRSGDAAHTVTGKQQITTMKDTLGIINDRWNTFTVGQREAVKELCDTYYATVSAWGLDNIYPINSDGSVKDNYTAVTGSVAVNSISGFTANGKLTAPSNGEGKVILETTPSGDKTVSVELHPGSGIINAGIYLGAANAGAAQDAINALYIGVESHFSGWDDAANRVDLVVGQFPAWAEYSRVVSETGRGNNLFSGGVKKPLLLTVQVSGNVVTATVSLLEDPAKSITTTYTCTGFDLANGQVGLRSQYSGCAFDNFRVADMTYTFENEAATAGLNFYHSAHGDGIQINSANTLALHSAAAFTEGTFAATMNTAGKNAAGIVFGADDAGENYFLFRITGNQNVELVKVENGVETVLDRGYLSAGHIYTNDNRLEIVKNGDTVYCYYYNRFDKINCYAVENVAQYGARIGLWAATSGTIFRDVTVTENTEKRTAEVLIFGHSYTEMWPDYETYFPEYTDIDDIGIGGSVAVHWEALADEVISYEPKLGIYNIGINDLTGSTSPEAVIESMENALLDIKAALPEFEVVLVSVSHCPARPTITAQISQTNALMRNLAASYDWMSYAEAEYLFCSDPADPLSTIESLFIDRLHPSAEGYRLMADVIKSAIRGENQPVFDEELAQQQMAEKKSAKLASLNIYGENAYTAENWATAKPYYDAAIAKINACTTEAQLKALDLSEEIAALSQIPNKAPAVVENLVNPATRDALAAEGWTAADANTLRVSGYSYALDNTQVYGDTELVFSVGNNTGDVATGGVFLRAEQLDNNGIVGYLINYVSSGNYLQVYYVNNVYNTDGSSYTLQYIGGINYGSYGSILGTEFYAKIEGDTLYLNTLERHMAGLATLATVDLTYNGTFGLIETGYVGALSWNGSIAFDLTLKNFAAEEVLPEAPLDGAQQLIANLTDPASREAYNAGSWSKVDKNTIKVNGFGYALDSTAQYGDSEIVFKVSNHTGDIGTGGVFLRATPRANGGVDGYLINYVTANNFIQIYYLSNVYNTDGSEYTLTYLGGIVYGNYGNVADTAFCAKIEGSTLYVNSVERQQQGSGWLATVDLTYGGAYEVYACGYTGVLAWNNGVSYDVTVQSFSGEKKDDVLKVLAIGNSFSIDGMEYVYQIAQDQGVKKIKLGNLYIGGCTLATHYSNFQSNNTAYTYYVNTDGNWVANNNYSLRAALKSDDWDVITFQQASGYSGVADSYDTLPDLIAGVKTLCPDAKLGWHMTWAYQGDSNHADFGKYNNDQATMYQAIVSAVQSKILTNSDIDFVIPAGTAIQNARTSLLGDTLTRDGYHLSYDVGRYIAGITWVEALTGKAVTDLTYCPAGITKDIMELCVESAANAAQVPYGVTASTYTLEERYIELDLNLVSGWYDSTNTSGDPQKVFASTSSLPFFRTKVFSKAELPEGTIIVNSAGYSVRPEGWVNGEGATRPAAVSTPFVVVTDAWWGDWTERAFNIKVASLEVTAEETEAGFKIYVPLSAYDKVELTVEKAFYNANLYSASQTQAASTSLKFFTVQTFTEDTLPVGSIIVNAEGRNIRLERWIDGTVKNSDGTRGPNSTAKQHQVDASWWDGFDTRAFNIPVASLEDSEIDALLASFTIYVPKGA